GHHTNTGEFPHRRKDQCRPTGRRDAVTWDIHRSPELFVGPAACWAGTGKAQQAAGPAINSSHSDNVSVLAAGLYLDSVDKPPARRQRFQEVSAVALVQKPGIEDYHHAAVGAGADQPAKALLELDDRLGNLQVQEGQAAGLLDRL